MNRRGFIAMVASVAGAAAASRLFTLDSGDDALFFGGGGRFYLRSFSAHGLSITKAKSALATMKRGDQLVMAYQLNTFGGMFRWEPLVPIVFVDEFPSIDVDDPDVDWLAVLSRDDGRLIAMGGGSGERYTSFIS